MFYHRILGAACLLLAAAAVELYDEVPPAELDNEIVFQDNNEIDTRPHHKLQLEDEAARLQDLLFFRLIKEQLREDQATEHRTNKNLQLTNMADIFNSLPKRLAPSNGNSRPQRRWKTKKGRGVGSQMVCYFKLCAFRNPA